MEQEALRFSSGAWLYMHKQSLRWVQWRGVNWEVLGVTLFLKALHRLQGGQQLSKQP